MCVVRHSGAAILSPIRAWMSREGVAALIVSSSDAHNSETVAPHRNRRALVSNFYGSAGTVVLTAQQALLWTDGRYWLEAADSLYREYDLMPLGRPGTPTMEDWLHAHLPDGARVGIDAYRCTVAEWSRLSRQLHLHAVSDVWALLPSAPAQGAPHAEEEEKLPPPPPPPSGAESAALWVLPERYCGAPCAERCAGLVEAMRAQGAEVMLLSALDEVAWLTNLRGNDVPYSPVFYSYALIDAAVAGVVRVYVDLDKVTREVRESMGRSSPCVTFAAYECMETDLAQRAANRVVLMDEQQTSQAVCALLERVGARVVRTACGPAQTLKAVKTAVELQGFRDCHVRDGVALTRFLAWLFYTITGANRAPAAAQGGRLCEYDAAAKLDQLRRENDRFVELSFPTISAFGANAARCHYRASPAHSAVMAPDGLYLVDSGAHYLDGTTDVTRTICFDAAAVTEKQRVAYTRVLQGHLRLHHTIFPEHGITGHRLDALARVGLWESGLDYAHGTGHGVGHCLLVHEGPHGIGTRPGQTGATLAAQMIVSNEPGYYEEGAFGIRIENLEEIVRVRTPFADTGFVTFRALTMAPLCRELIDAALLSAQERQWVNAYHAEVVERVMPGLKAAKDEAAIAYLTHHTQPI